jgi:hypothetical protein
MSFEVPQQVAEYCQAKGLHNPRIVPTCGCLRALADHPKQGVVFIPPNVFQVSTVGDVSGYAS